MFSLTNCNPGVALSPRISVSANLSANTLALAFENEENSATGLDFSDLAVAPSYALAA